tara:strand:- start:168 stop:326 length:159 start_codon:yes stop_codon:yes gene_type:complete
VKEALKDLVPVDTSGASHNLLILLMFRPVMVYTRRINYTLAALSSSSRFEKW